MSEPGTDTEPAGTHPGPPLATFTITYGNGPTRCSLVGPFPIAELIAALAVAHASVINQQIAIMNAAQQREAQSKLIIPTGAMAGIPGLRG